MVNAIQPSAPDLLADLRAAQGSPTEVLRLVSTYRAVLDAVAEQAVATARGLGMSWDEIAAAVGTTRQSAWQKYRGRDPATKVVPMVLLRFPHRRKQHLALRDAIEADYGVTVPEQRARELAAELTTRRPGPMETTTLIGRNAAGERAVKAASMTSIARYLLPVPANWQRSRPRSAHIDAHR